MTNPGVNPSGASGGGLKGMMADAPTLAASGLVGAVAFATVAGFFGFLVDPSTAGFRGRLLNLTNTVDVGDVALLGIAAVLLLLTVDPPGGFPRAKLLAVVSLLAGIVTCYGVIRAIVLISLKGSGFMRLDNAVATLGVAIAAATVGYYTARESFAKPRTY